MLYGTKCKILTLETDATFIDFVTIGNDLKAIILMDDGTVSVFDHYQIMFTELQG